MNSLWVAYYVNAARSDDNIFGHRTSSMVLAIVQVYNIIPRLKSITPEFIGARCFLYTSTLLVFYSRRDAGRRRLHSCYPRVLLVPNDVFSNIRVLGFGVMFCNLHKN